MFKKLKSLLALLMVGCMLFCTSCTFEEAWLSDKIHRVRYSLADLEMGMYPLPQCPQVDPKELENYEQLKKQAEALVREGSITLSDQSKPWLDGYMNIEHALKTVSAQSIGNSELFFGFCLTYTLINDYFETFEDVTHDYDEKEKEDYTEKIIGALYFLDEYCMDVFKESKWITVTYLTASAKAYLLKNHETYHAYHELFRTMLGDSYPVTHKSIVDDPKIKDRWQKVKDCRAYYQKSHDAQKALERLSEFYDWENSSRLD
ncbi:MAG: hypothetical protein IJX08_05270 [Clostridia bacterium]|nr:hypothetical protein [Clostridia bacterium]